MVFFEVFILRYQNLSANRYEKINYQKQNPSSPSMVTVALKKFWNVTLFKKKNQSLQKSLSSDTKRPTAPENSSLVPLVSRFTRCAEWLVPARYFCSHRSVLNDSWLILSCAHFWFRQSVAWSTKLLTQTSLATVLNKSIYKDILCENFLKNLYNLCH